MEVAHEPQHEFVPCPVRNRRRLKDRVEDARTCWMMSHRNQVGYRERIDTVVRAVVFRAYVRIESTRPDRGQTHLSSNTPLCGDAMFIIELSNKAPCVCGWSTPGRPPARCLGFSCLPEGFVPSRGVDRWDWVRYSYEITVRVDSTRTSVYLPKAVLGVGRKERTTAGLRVSSGQTRSIWPRKDVRAPRKTSL